MKDETVSTDMNYTSLAYNLYNVVTDYNYFIFRLHLSEIKSVNTKSDSCNFISIHLPKIITI